MIVNGLYVNNVVRVLLTKLGIGIDKSHYKLAEFPSSGIQE